MASSLRARLARMKGTSSSAVEGGVPSGRLPRGTPALSGKAIPAVFSGWEKAGDQVLRRALRLPLKTPPPAVLPEALPILLPDLAGAAGRGQTLPPERILFFDLETTGLSGGAGTVAFLAAFGKFAADGGGSPPVTSLEVTQFLLLDYPGEADFIDGILAFFKKHDSCSPFLTTYNGKSFDTPLLKTRCLMNGFAPPKLPQLDLLYPARRMWKRLLPNCSQATVETLVLGLDRTGDIPGSFAPDIWFDFLRSGGDEDAARRLLGICDHNVKDITGLAALFGAFAGIAENPAAGAKKYGCDAENLAMLWRRAHTRAVPGPLFRVDEGQADSTAAELLEMAARNYPRACLRLGFDLFRAGRDKEARAALKRAASDTAAWRVPRSAITRAMALRALAVDAEKRLKRRELARAYCETALDGDGAAAALPALPRGLREDLRQRLERLGAVGKEKNKPRTC